MINYFRVITKLALQRFLILFMCFALLTPTLEEVVFELGILSDADFSVAELLEGEEESKESEKELEQAELVQWLQISFVLYGSTWSVEDHSAKSLVREIPSPPPDYIS